MSPRGSRALIAAAALAAFPSRAFSAARLDYSRPEDLPASPCGDGGTSRRIYEGDGLGVYLLRVRPGAQRAFLRFRGETVTVVPRGESYFSTKVVSTRPGVKSMSLDRGDFFAHGAGEATGGWFVGPAHDFDLLYLTFPPGFPKVLGVEEGRRTVADRKPSTVHALAAARAALDAGAGALRRATLFDRGARVDLIRLSSAAEISNPGASGAIVFPIEGRASAGGADSPLRGESLLVLSSSETTRLEPLDGRPFYALVVARSTAPPAAISAPTRTTAAVPASASRPGSSRIEWVRIPGGRFMMGADGGNEAPRHRVEIRSFELSRTQVTFAQYRACVAAGACRAPAADCASAAFTGDDQPVVCVDWEEARAFAAWSGGRLPSEAEWEYAARGGGDRRYAWGDEEADCSRVVIRENEAGACGREATWPVCSRPLGNTAQGLCDMGGNVWEWVQDWYHDSYEGAPADGEAWERPSSWGRVERSGSWIFPSSYARASSRTADEPGVRGNYLGFRVAR